MKKLLVIASVLTAFTGIVSADIQAPPGSTYTSTRKLGRAISNIIYGFMEIPEQMILKNEEGGRKEAWSYGVVDGTSRALRRLAQEALRARRHVARAVRRGQLREVVVHHKVDHPGQHLLLQPRARPRAPRRVVLRAQGPPPRVGEARGGGGEWCGVVPSA